MVGETLDGRYSVLGKLGEGGMGEVYLVENLRMQRREALKVLRHELSGDKELIRRFVREGRATARLNHPNIVAAYELGRLADGRLFLTMELVEGPRVSDELRRSNGMSVPESLLVLAQLTRAVAHAHQLGVVHRDLKPDNLVLERRTSGVEVVKVLDFGIAKIIAPDHHTVALTAEGMLLGTPQYMPPEAFSGETVDTRADIYAIGCIAYELIVGRVPFEGTLLRVTTAHLAEPPPRPGERVPGVPPEYDALVKRCMAKQPGDRFATAAELLDAITAIPGYTDQPLRRAGQVPRQVAAERSADWEEETGTEERSFDGPPGVDSLAQTGFVSVQDLAPLHQTTIRQLCELMLGLGGGQSLRGAFAELRAAEQELAQVDFELKHLDDAAAEIDGQVRAEEISLRGRLDELRDRMEETTGDTAQLTSEYLASERRLAELWREAREQARALDDRSLDLAASRAIVEDRIAALYEQLSRAVDEDAPRYAEDASVAPVLGRLNSLAQMMRRASAGRS